MSIKILNREYQSVYYQVADKTTWFIGNTGDWVELKVTFEATIQFNATSSQSLSLDNVNKTITLNNGRTWYEYGFDIGNTLTLNYTESIDANNDGNFVDTNVVRTFNIVNIYGDTVELDFSSFDLDIGYEIIPTDRGNRIIKNVKCEVINPIEGLKFTYTHLTNETYQSNNLNSLIDGTKTQFIISNLDQISNETTTPLEKTGLQSGMAIQNCFITKHAPLNSIYTYTLSCRFMVTGFFDPNDNLDTLNIPEILLSDGSFTDNFHIEGYPKWNNPNVSISNDLTKTQLKGNTGWFGENYNGLANTFTVDKIQYTDDDNNVVSQLDYSNSTSVAIEISNIKNLSPDSKFTIGFTWVPIDTNDYFNKETPYHHNLLMNTGKPVETVFDENLSFNLDENTGTTTYQGYTNGSHRMDMQPLDNILFSAGGQEKVVVRAKFIPNTDFTSFFDARSEDDRKYIIWVSVADHTLDINYSNRVSLPVDYNTMAKVIQPDGELDGMLTTFIEHPQDDGVQGVSKYCGFLEDDVLARSLFKINTEEDIFINSITFGYEVENINTGSTYTLEEYSVNTSIYPKITNIQQINFEDSRGFNMVEGNNKNWVKILRDTDNDEGVEVGYKCFFATKIRWQDWISRDNVPTEFYNNSLLNNGYNNNWLDYLRSGTLNEYKINFFVITDLTKAEEEKLYKNTFEITFNGYDENLNIVKEHNYFRHSDNTLLNIGTDPDSGNNLGIILSDEYTRVEITFTHQSLDFDFPNMYGVITLEEANGDGQNRFLSTYWDSEPFNPLIPLETETKLKMELVSSNVIKTSCLIDPNLLENVEKYKITGRIGCWPEALTNPSVQGKYEEKYEDKYE